MVFHVISNTNAAYKLLLPQKRKPGGGWPWSALVLGCLDPRTMDVTSSHVLLFTDPGQHPSLFFEVERRGLGANS